MENQTFDVVIIGGGPAGLNAALVLGRARKAVLVIDEGKPRNRVTHEAHGFLTRDGIQPGELRRIAREQITVYPSVIFADDKVVSAEGADGHFQISTASSQTYHSRKLLFTAGMKDRPLPVKGLAEVYGTSAFVCPYCDGWELRDQRLVVINKGTEAFHFAQLISGWTKRFTLCTNGPDELSDEQRQELLAHQVQVLDSPIKGIESVNGQVRQVVLEDGTTVPCEGIFFKPDLAAGSDLPKTLGCEVTETDMVVVDEFGKTTVPGVYSAGDAASRAHQAIMAASAGAFAAAALNNELNMEAWRQHG
ncbi:NAD(P)/FAD-dependent oxidoreductase [Paenibacillus physcomitrellae]|nr:NAD(P)/FAD-dependent oxidoreductase [Paenibacillus physcomitrellae]